MGNNLNSLINKKNIYIILFTRQMLWATEAVIRALERAC